MRLRAVRIENWRRIGSLELNNLPPGITILYGPNGTGKTSLVSALRCCLFDFAHDTGHQDLLRHKPWRGDQSPKIMVEWERDKTAFRVRKTYSKHKDGESVLEELSTGQWRKKHEGAREVADKLREMFGAEKSDSGLYQLLWLEQGAVRLPESLNGTLQQQLFQVLGSMVTKRDRDFQQKLDERLERWFTPNKMQHRTGKKPSPVVKLEEEQKQRQAVLDSLEATHRDMEQVLRQLADIEDDLPRKREDVEAAQQHWEALRQERDSLRERVQEHRLVQHKVQEAEKRLAEERKKLQDRQGAEQRREESKRRVEEAARADDETQQEVQRYARQVEQARLQRQAHLELVENARKDLDNLEDQRQYLELRETTSRRAELLASVEEAEKEIQTVEETLKATAVLDADMLKALRENRREAQVLAARLEAATLRLRLEPHHLTTVELQRDNESVEMVHLPAKKSHTATALQRFVLRLSGWGEIILERDQEVGNLAQDAQELAEKDEGYARTLKAYGEDPSDPNSLDRLNERRLLRDRQQQRLALLQKNLHALAPQGKPSIVAELRRLAQERKDLLQRRPYLEKWEPEEPEPQASEQMQRELQAKYEKQVRELDAVVAQAEQQRQKAETKLQTCKEALLEERARAKERQEECQRLGDPTQLCEKVAQAETALRQVRASAEATKLTPEQESIGPRVTAAENALQQKQARLRQMEDELHRLRGRLEGSEGLHLKRADAEAALRTCEQELAQERLDADAHKLLRELFEESRESQVRQVMGPIGERVQTWARQLGLHDLPPLRFSDSFLPDGFVHPHIAEETLTLGQESYGIAEQLSLLVRLALGGILTHNTPSVAVFDDPLAHTDALRRQRFLEILHQAAQGNSAAVPPSGPLQILILTCHPEWFDELPGVHALDLAKLIQRS